MRSVLALLLIPAAFAQQRNFVACPLVRDTKTVPCFLAEYEGETYFLGIQQDITASFYPPQLLHEVLVEGSIAPGPRVCGGIPLQPLKISVLPEINRACNTILPAEPGIEAPPAKRPAGPSTRQAPVSTAPQPSARPTPPFGPRDFSILFDFDSDFLFARDTRMVEQAAEYALAAHASRVEVTSYRAASLLSNGKALVERESIAEERAKDVSGLLRGLGVQASTITIRAVSEPSVANGLDDPTHRLVLIRLVP